jgi:hypothetical protein
MSCPVCTLISATVESDPTGRDAVKVACDHCGSFGLTVPPDGVLPGGVLKPAAKRAGFDLFKLDDRPRAGLIDDRMRVEIRASDFIVADLTHDNPGA